MATAAFKLNTLSQERIDAENSVIYGVRLCEVGKVARFNGPDGKPRTAEITSEHAAAFLAHAGNRAIPVHWTHDYLNDAKDRLHAKVGALKNFRLDASGNPIADFYVAPSEYKDAILWNAKEDPENMMLSAVFSYDPKDPKAMPMDLQAADLVECGAATTALFSEAKAPYGYCPKCRAKGISRTRGGKNAMDTCENGHQYLSSLSLASFSETQPTNNTMTEEEIKALVAPMIAEAVKAAMNPEVEAEVEMAAAAEAEAGVTEADMKPEDANKPAAMRAALRIARATSRLTQAALAASKDETVKLAEAQFTKALGSGKFVIPAGDDKTDEVEKALAAYSGVSKPQAILKLAKDKPEVYNAFRAAGKL